jgi:Flp pilus assembly protein TadD
MWKMPHKLIAAFALTTAFVVQYASAGDTLRIRIPRRSELTPVQRLNREGVDAVSRRQYEKAETLFYKAYLYDPADPFTLNNLGYVSEIQGELDRAHQFYALASEQGSDATIDRSNTKELEGKPMNYAFNSLQDIPMRVNRMNIDAMDMLSKNRGFQAVSLLREALSVDPKNPFTLNNLGVGEEAIGDYPAALMDYGAAADLHSSDPVVVTLDRSWRGKPVSAMATASARRLEERLKKMDSAEANSVLFTLRGVSATNQNDWPGARQDFIQAYLINPANAFSLNNRGYVAEKDGDPEAAKLFYEKARKADGSNVRIGLATVHSAEGKKLLSVASDSDQQVTGKLEQYSHDRLQETGPIELIPRSNPQGQEPNVVPGASSQGDIAPVVAVPGVLKSPN